MPQAEFCEQCRRPRHTDAELQRWKDEIAAFNRQGGDGRYFNPEWAKALCWTKPGYSCLCKPAETSPAS